MTTALAGTATHLDEVRLRSALDFGMGMLDS